MITREEEKYKQIIDEMFGSLPIGRASKLQCLSVANFQLCEQIGQTCSVIGKTTI